MGIETPNLLSRETTFLMGILKKCLSVEKTQNEPNNQISSLPVSGHSVPPTEADPLTPAEADPLASTGRSNLAIQFRPRKQLQMLQIRPRKEYFAIQFRSRKIQLHLRPRTDLR